MTLTDVLDELRERCPAQPLSLAVIELPGRQITYGDLWSRVEALSAGLREYGFRPGDNALFSIRPGIESLTLILAIAHAGGAIIAADPGMPDGLFHARLARLEIRWTFAESVLYGLASAAPVRHALQRRGVALPNLTGFTGSRLVLSGPRMPWFRRAITVRELLRSIGSSPAPLLHPEDPVLIVFTSGTTEAPRAAVHTGSSIGATVELVSGHLDLGPGDVIYTDQLHLQLPALLAGARVILPRKQASPEQFPQHLARHQVTHVFALPARLQRVVELAERTGHHLPDHLRHLILGSAPVYRGFLERLRRVLSPATRVWAVYAMTEMLPVAWVDIDEKLVYEGEGDLVGTPCPGVRVRVDDRDELWVSGPNLFRGYVGERPVLEHATGDLARIDDRGRLLLLGRGKEMIIRGEKNIYSAIVEDQIAGIPGVRRCALVGVYREHRADEVVVLAVEPVAGVHEPELRRSLLAEMRTGAHRIEPASYPDVVVMTRIPLAGRSDKIDRDALRRQVAQHVR